MVTKQMDNFIEMFLEYDKNAISLGYTSVLRVKLRVNVRKPLKRKKQTVLLNGSLNYVKFAYEKLELFCFLCLKLGHEESFCPLRILQDKQDYSFCWDISLRAPFKRAVVLSSVQLREKDLGYLNLREHWF